MKATAHPRTDRAGQVEGGGAPAALLHAATQPIACIQARHLGRSILDAAKGAAPRRATCGAQCTLHRPHSRCLRLRRACNGDDAEQGLQAPRVHGTVPRLARIASWQLHDVLEQAVRRVRTCVRAIGNLAKDARGITVRDPVAALIAQTASIGPGDGRRGRSKGRALRVCADAATAAASDLRVRVEGAAVVAR